LVRWLVGVGVGWGGEETTTMRILHNPNDIKDVVI
jgi:hypothetical protein